MVARFSCYKLRLLRCVCGCSTFAGFRLYCAAPRTTIRTHPQVVLVRLIITPAPAHTEPNVPETVTGFRAAAFIRAGLSSLDVCCLIPLHFFQNPTKPGPPIQTDPTGRTTLELLLRILAKTLDHLLIVVVFCKRGMFLSTQIQRIKKHLKPRAEALVQGNASHCRCIQQAISGCGTVLSLCVPFLRGAASITSVLKFACIC